MSICAYRGREFLTFVGRQAGFSSYERRKEWLSGGKNSTKNHHQNCKENSLVGSRPKGRNRPKETGPKEAGQKEEAGQRKQAQRKPAKRKKQAKGNRHKGLHCAPLLGPLSIGEYLDSGEIEQVACGGENYGGSRPCDFEWVKELRNECVSRNITFCFMETGTVFIKDGREYRIRSKQQQNLQAYKSGMTSQGRPMSFELRDSSGNVIPKEKLYVPHYVKKCEECSFRILCNGCSDCGMCEG